MADEKKPQNYKRGNNQRYYNNQRQRQKPPKTENNSANESYETSSLYTGTPTTVVPWSKLSIMDMYSPDQLANMVMDPMGNYAELRELSLVLYGVNGTFTHSVDYMTAMPTLDKVVVTHGKSKTRKANNKALMEATLRQIRDDEIIRDSLWKGMVEGTVFYYFETTTRPLTNKKFMNEFDVQSISEINEVGVNASIIALPSDPSYTRIVGRKNGSYILAFNLEYLRSGDAEPSESKLRKYPKEIRDAYKKWTGNNRSTGNWVILDNNHTIVHKIRSKMDEPFGRPLVLAAIKDILYGDYFTETKHNVLDEINNRIIYETFPEGKEKGTSALSKKQQEQQHETVKRAVLNKNNRGGLSFFSVAAGTKLDALKAQDTSIFDSKNEEDLNDKIALDIGMAGNLLNGVGSGTYSAQTNNLELITAQLFQWIAQIEKELNKCINALIIKDKRNRVEVKYLPITHVNKSTMVGFAKDLYLQGKGSLSLWASACGISTDVFTALLDYELEEGWEDKYPVHKTSYTQSPDDPEAGRPTTDTPSDNTVKSNANGGNDLPSPSDK